MYVDYLIDPLFLTPCSIFVRQAHSGTEPLAVSLQANVDSKSGFLHLLGDNLWTWVGYKKDKGRV